MKVSPAALGDFEAAHPSLGYSIGPPFMQCSIRSATLNRTLITVSDSARRGPPPKAPVKGRFRGIVDTGIDATPIFGDATGHTRIAWLLDLSHPPIHKHPELEAAFGLLADHPAQTPCAVLDSSRHRRSFRRRPRVRPCRYRWPRHACRVHCRGERGGDARFVGGAPGAASLSRGER